MTWRTAWRGRLLVGLLATGTVLSVSLPPAAALTPESPEVKRAVAKAVAFLESDAANDVKLGARALVGLVMLKNGADATHPKVKAAAEAIVHEVAKKEPADIKIDLYSTGLSIIFLATLDPSRYFGEIETLVGSFRVRQKPHGGWGYAERETGDTSMTQYAVLSCWEAAQVGLAIPPEMIDAVITWLLKTQDPSGGFGYQGTVSETSHLVAQKGVSHSMSAAGLGSLYIGADLLGLAERVERRDGLPQAFKEVKVAKDAPAEQEQRPTAVDAKALRQAQSRGNIWMRRNFDVNPKGWTHYYLYALERYSSFRELAEGRTEREPRWYTEGAKQLIDSQAEDGSWNSKAGVTADTAFAALFLLRSTAKSIERARNFGAGVMIVGQGLPHETSAVEVRLGRVVVKSDRSPSDELIALLEHPEHADFARALDAVGELPLSEIEALCTKHLARLEQLSQHASPLARLAAVRAMGRVRNMNCVPALIRALDDANAEVAADARSGLLRISRRTELTAAPTSEPERRHQRQQWVRWYMAVCPDAELGE
jgi:hypothetical protein